MLGDTLSFLVFTSTQASLFCREMGSEAVNSDARDYLRSCLQHHTLKLTKIGGFKNRQFNFDGLLRCHYVLNLPGILS